MANVLTIPIAGIIAQSLMRLGVIHRSRLPTITVAAGAIFVPGEAISIGAYLVDPHVVPWGLMIVFGVPFMAVLVRPLFSSSASVQRFLRPLRAWAWTGLPALAAAPILNNGDSEAYQHTAEALMARIAETLAEQDWPKNLELCRSLAALAEDAVALAQRLRESGHATDAVRLLSAIAAHNATAALRLHDYDPDSPATNDRLRSALATASWLDRRRIRSVLPVSPEGAGVHSPVAGN